MAVGSIQNNITSVSTAPPPPPPPPPPPSIPVVSQTAQSSPAYVTGASSNSSLQIPSNESPLAQALLDFVQALVQVIQSNPGAFNGLLGGSTATAAVSTASGGQGNIGSVGATGSGGAGTFSSQPYQSIVATSVNTTASGSINSAAGASFQGDLPSQDAPATYNASTHALVVANTPNYDQVAAAVKQQFTTMADPGVPNQMSAAQQQEFIDSTIDCAERYLPSSLPLTQRTALVLADVGAESSFKVGTAGPNGQYGDSVGLQQVTPSIWGSGAGYKGGSQNFDPQSIWGNMHLANWAIASIGSSGGQGGNQTGGTKAASWYTGLYYWSGNPQTGATTLPSTQYRVNQENYLAKVGLSPNLLDATW